MKEEDKPFHVITYLDHVPNGAPVYFSEYRYALAYWRDRVLSQALDARYTAGVTLFRTDTGEPLHRQNWRVG